MLPLPFVIAGNRHLILLSIGALAMWFGMACLRGVNAPGAGWEAATRRCFWAAMCATFLSPFAYLWCTAPTHDYLTCNLSLFLASSVVLLCATNQLVRELGEFLEDRMLAGMARASLGCCCGLMVPPLVAGFLGVLIKAHWEGVYFWTVAGLLLANVPFWLQLLTLIPALLTFALLWVAQVISLRRIAQLSAEPVAGSEPFAPVREGQGSRVGGGPNETLS
jgi:hypothetical protein